MTAHLNAQLLCCCSGVRKGGAPLQKRISFNLSVLDGADVLQYPQLAGEVRAAVSDLAALKFEVLQKVGDALSVSLKMRKPAVIP